MVETVFPSRNLLTGPGFFRLLLAVVVFVHHVSSFALGTAAVEIFFCLSGYWIYKMWTQRYSRSISPVLTYLVSRVWRLVPTFALIAVLTLIFQTTVLNSSWDALRGSASWPRFIFSHVAIFGYQSLPVQPLGPAWSLDIEMQFYAVAPLLILFAIRFGGSALVAVSALASLVGASLLGEHLLTFLVFFSMGISAAHCDWRPTPRLALTAGGLIVLFVAGVFASPWRGALLGGAHPDEMFQYSSIVNTFVAMLAFPVAILTTHQASDERDRTFGDLSYIVYLVHWSASCWLGTVSNLSLPLRLLCVAFALAATFVVSLIIWRYFDKPINLMRGRWVARRLRQPHPSSRLKVS